MSCIKLYIKFKLLILAIFISPLLLQAGITGKISGQITDADTGEPLIGANIILVGTSFGAAADVDGYYTVLNISPGTYKIKVSTIGYQTEYVEGVKISIDRTSKLNFSLKPITIGLDEEVIVVANRENIETDVSFSQSSFTAKEMKLAPASSDIREAVEFSPGVYRNDRGQIEIRGGQMDEVGVYVDDISTQNSRTGVGVLNMPKGAIQEIQVIRGGFNAEYGQAQSGIINIVTKTSQKKYAGSIDITTGLTTKKHFGPNYFSHENYYHVGQYLEMDPVTRIMPWRQDTLTTFEGWNNVWSEDLEDGYSKALGRSSKYGNNPEEALEIWKWRHRSQEYSDEHDLNVDGTLTGPVPFTNDKVSFFVAGHYNRSIYPFRFQQNNYNEYSGQLKLNYNPITDLRISYHGSLSKSEGSSYTKGSTQIADPRSWLTSARVMGNLFANNSTSTAFYNADSYLKTNSLEMNSHTVKLNYFLNSNSFLEGYISFKSTKENANIDVPYRNVDDIVQTIGGLELDSAPFNYVNKFENDVYFGGYDVLGKHKLGGAGDVSQDFSSNKTITFKADYNNQINNSNLIKAGVWFQNQNMMLNHGGQYLVTSRDGNLVDVEKKEWFKREIPFYEFAGYIQDKIEIEGLVLNFGLRGDGFYNEDPSLPNWDEIYSQGNIEDTLYNLPDSVSPRNNWKFYISPRVGIAHPISESSKLFLNYGYFYQRPTVERLFYSQYRPDNVSSTLEEVGQSDLEFRKTIQYEIGFEQMVKNWFRITLSGYFRDVSSETTITQLTDKNNATYRRYFPNQYADISGFEVNIRVPRQSFVGGWINFDYRTKTSGSYGYRYYSELSSGDRIENSSNPVVTKARPAARANLVFYSPEFNNSIANAILSQTTLSFMYQWKAGEYFTYHSGNTILDDLDPLNMQWKNFSRLDLRFMKVINIGSSDLTISLDIRNLLNTKYFHPELMDALSNAKDYTKVTKNEYFEEIKRLGLTPGDVDHPEIQHMLEQTSYWIFYGEPIQMWLGVEWTF